MTQFWVWLNLQKTCELRRAEIDAGREVAERVKPRLDLRELEVALRNLSQILWLSPAVVAEILRLAREEKR